MLHKKLIQLRAGSLDESHVYHSIRRSAWEVTFRHIYSEETIESYFQGDTIAKKTWPSIKYKYSETLVCEIDDSESGKKRVIGYAKWEWDLNSLRGELENLYVAPEYWNAGCGSMMWDKIIANCRSKNILSLDIWVLERAQSGKFYSSRNCKRVNVGDYFVGDHKEIASCYRWTPDNKHR